MSARVELGDCESEGQMFHHDDDVDAAQGWLSRAAGTARCGYGTRGSPRRLCNPWISRTSMGYEVHGGGRGLIISLSVRSKQPPITGP
jgi:hypothetical protein